MNTVVTSRQQILDTARRLIQQKGWEAVSIRAVASACGVSVGSIYNYFDSKAALTGAVVESVWQEIFHRPQGEEPFRDTRACLCWMYGRLEYGCGQYPGFFTLHSLGFLGPERPEGRQRMLRAWQHIRQELCEVLRRDASIRPDAFGGDFTPEKFADLLFNLLLAALLRQDFERDTALEMLKRTLYRPPRPESERK